MINKNLTTNLDIDNKILLIDGTSYIYRAYHAMPPLTSLNKEEVGALFAVLNMLKKISIDYPFKYSCFVLDAKGKNFRHNLYKDYKANRPPMPEDLRPQIVWVEELVSLLGWPILKIAGVEADDVIATLTKKLVEKYNFEVLISTIDKDLMQLVSNQVSLINTMQNKLIDEQAVIEKFGVKPSQVLDYLTLIGDNSDNIPGVEKCGDKTARKWLNEYGTLDNLLVNKNNIKGKIGENLEKSLSWIYLSKKLISLKFDVDLGVDDNALFSFLEKKNFNLEKLKERFEYFGFKSWIKDINQKIEFSNELFTDKQDEVDKFIDFEYRLVNDNRALSILINLLKESKVIGFDTETTSLNPYEALLVGMSFAFLDKKISYYVPLASGLFALGEEHIKLDFTKVLILLKPLLEDKNLKKIGQNLKYDKHVLKNHNISLNGISGDSMLASYLLESHLGHGLDELSLRHLNKETIKYEDLCGKGINQIPFVDVPLDKAKDYACQDAHYSILLEKNIVKKLNEKELDLYKNLELPLLDILFHIERTGVLIDKSELLKQGEDLKRKIEEIKEDIYTDIGFTFNLNSPKQLQEVLFEKLKISNMKVSKTKSGQFSTDEKTLLKLSLNHELPRKILDYRSFTKLKSTYVDKLLLLLDKNNRIHTNYNQAVTITGRLASNNPNLQNIPVRTEDGKRIRKAFIARKGFKILSADYSQIELRIMAHLSEDEILINAFNNNEDIHKRTAAEIFHINQDKVTSMQRRYAKTINFGLIYGMSQYGLSESLSISNEEAKFFIDSYFLRYPKIKDYMDKIKLFAAEYGYVETIFGRKLYLTDINSRNVRNKSSLQRTAINAPMQGSAADLIKKAMINVFNFINDNSLKSRIIMQVHDELVLEVSNDEIVLFKEKLPELMNSVANLKVPLLCDIGVGDNWENAH